MLTLWWSVDKFDRSGNNGQIKRNFGRYLYLLQLYQKIVIEEFRTFEHCLNI